MVGKAGITRFMLSAGWTRTQKEENYENTFL